MAKIAFAILGFSLMLNFATGLMFELIPEFNTDISLSGTYKYNDGHSDNFVNGLEGEVRPSGGAVEDKGSALWRVLDMINIGFITKIFEYILNYLYGFVKFIGLIMQPILSPSMWSMLFSELTGIFYLIMHIVYITAGISAWTGRDLSGR
jgi:hypothetical protein